MKKIMIVVSAIIIFIFILLKMPFIISSIAYLDSITYPKNGEKILTLKYSSKYKAVIGGKAILLDFRYNPKCDWKYDHVFKIDFGKRLNSYGKINPSFATTPEEYAKINKMKFSGNRLLGNGKFYEFNSQSENFHKTTLVKFTQNIMIEIEIIRDACSVKEAGADIDTILNSMVLSDKYADKNVN
ncbi:MAG: hypothetical protein PHE15_03340 [Dehalococcoidales bacterium]|nr:hypothetical protein [Dehalococcoidales bacterium]